MRLTDFLVPELGLVAAYLLAFAAVALGIKSWLRLSEQFPANDKWCSAGFRSLEGAGCWV
jgi:hypothetical protein